MNYRPEYQHAWSGKTSYSQMRLDALPAESAGELLEALLGDDPGLAPLKQLLVKRGNPFFLEETVRTLVETKALVVEHGRYRLTQPVQAIQVPPTVQVMLAARIDRLPPEDKRLLQGASVVGKDVPFALLQAIAELPDEALRGGLDRLQSAEFLYETGFYPDLEYAFKHALTHEVTYGTLLHERGRTLHASLVEAIERLHGEGLDEQAERLAYHAIRGDLWGKAVSYCRLAGAKALARSASREAAAHFEQALTALACLPETLEAREQAIDFRLGLRRALFVLGDIGQGIEHLREAERLAREIDDHPRLGRVLGYLSNSVWMTGRSSEALALARNAKAIAGTAGDVQLTIATNYYLGLACLTSGDYGESVSLHRNVIGASDGTVGRDRVRHGGVQLGNLAELDGLGAGRAGSVPRGDRRGTGRDGLRLAERLNHPYTLAQACWNLAIVQTLRGDFDPAGPLLEGAFTVAREWQLAVWSGYLWWLQGRLYTLSARVTKGISLLRQSLEAHEAGGLGNWESLVLSHLAEAWQLAGRSDEALASGHRALALARERGERSHEAYALHILGEVAGQLASPQTEATEERYQEALALATKLGMRPLAAHCQLGLGKLDRRSGNREQAQQHLSRATTMYREMDMRLWREQADAALAEPR